MTTPDPQAVAWALFELRLFRHVFVRPGVHESRSSPPDRGTLVLLRRGGRDPGRGAGKPGQNQPPPQWSAPRCAS